MMKGKGGRRGPAARGRSNGLGSAEDRRCIHRVERFDERSRDTGVRTLRPTALRHSGITGSGIRWPELVTACVRFVCRVFKYVTGSPADGGDIDLDPVAVGEVDHVEHQQHGLAQSLELKGKVQVPAVLFYPGELDGAAGLRFMGVLDAEHNYRPKIF